MKLRPDKTLEVKKPPILGGFWLLYYRTLRRFLGARVFEVAEAGVVLGQFAEHSGIGISLPNQYIQNHLLLPREAHCFIGGVQLRSHLVEPGGCYVEALENFGYHFFKLAEPLVIGHTG